MKIKHIRVRKENLELTRPYSIAYKTVTSVENAIVEVELENGTVGLGASNPSKYVVNESLDECMATLSGDGPQAFVGRNIFEINSLCEEISREFSGSIGTMVALDIAFHDAFCKHLGISVVDFYGQKIKKLPTSITMGIKSLDEMMEEAREYVGRDFKILKVKLGKSLEEDLEILRKLRETFGNNVLIRIDANQGYSGTEFQKFYEATASLDLELVEQPLKADAINEMKNLPDAVKATIAADESLCNASDAFRLINGVPACGIFNIKLMKCGGIFQAKRIAEVAKHADVDLMWGCNDESIISISAALHVAFSCPHTKYIDLDGSLDLARDVVIGGFILEDGYMSIHPGVGLGVQKV